MKTSTTALKDVFKTLHGVIDKRSILPVLKSVLIDGDAFTVTDLDLTVTVKGGVTAKSKKPFAVEYSRINNLLKNIDSDDITFDVSDDRVNLNFGRAQYGIPCFDAVDFPPVDVSALSKHSSALGNAGIVEAMDMIKFAASTEFTRYYLNGIWFSKTKDGVPVLVATDGHTLAIKPITFIPKDAEGKIVHIDAVHYLTKLKREPEFCYFKDLKCQFLSPSVTVNSKLIDGVFPDWERVIPQNTVKQFAVNRAAMVSALKRINSFLFQRSGVVVEGEDDGGEISLRTDLYSGERSSEIVDAVIYPSNFVPLRIDAEKLLKVCQAFAGCERLTFDWESESQSSPVKITSAGSDMTCVLMPMRFLEACK